MGPEEMNLDECTYIQRNTFLSLEFQIEVIRSPKPVIMVTQMLMAVREYNLYKLGVLADGNPSTLMPSSVTIQSMSD